MNDLGLDSLDAVEVVMAFEDEFGKHFSHFHPSVPLYSIILIACFILQAVKYQMKRQKGYLPAVMQ